MMKERTNKTGYIPPTSTTNSSRAQEQNWRKSAHHLLKPSHQSSSNPIRGTSRTNSTEPKFPRSYYSP